MATLTALNSSSKGSTMADGISTMGTIFRTSCRKYADKVALRVPGPNGYEDVSYRQLNQKVRGYAAALKGLGLSTGDRLAMQSENCVEWALTDWACQCLGVILVPIYPTLPMDQAQYIVSDAGARVVIAGGADQAEKTKGMPGVEVIQLRGSDDSLAARAAQGELTEEELDAAIDATSPDGLATIIYTSGTTGNPKGVMLPHSALSWECNEVLHFLPITQTDTFFSFLPLSHVFERVAGHFVPITCGATIAYAKSLASLANDIQAVQPTIILAVPRFLEAMRDRILDGVSKSPPLRQKLFHAMLSQGTARFNGKSAPLAGLLDKIVASKVRARLGGRLRFFVAGGAALASHVAEFYNAFGITVIQGYGLTETCAGSCITLPGEKNHWTVGRPIGRIEVKLASDGEILIRAPSVMRGYYNLPEDTAAVIDAEGWFHTGDIGEWEGPYMKITDRKKDLLVLANGKNVAPQPIENKLKQSDFISEAVLFGDGSEYCYALIIPNFEALRKHVADLGMKPPSDDEMVHLDAVKALLKSEIDTVNKTLADFEKVKKHVLLNAAFSVDTGELTPSMKVRRKVVREKFAEQLASMVR